MNTPYWNLPREFPEWAETLSALTLYKKNEQVYLEGEPAHSFYYLKSGRVQVYVTSDTGVEKTLAIYGKHALLGEASFFDGSPRMSSARVIADSQIIPIGRQEILTYFAQQPSQALSMIESLARTVRHLSHQIHEISFLPAEQRITRFLLNESADGSQDIAYTQEEIASLIGCSRITVSRALSAFKSAGWIQTHYSRIHITNAQQLKIHAETL